MVIGVAALHARKMWYRKTLQDHIKTRQTSIEVNPVRQHSTCDSTVDRRNIYIKIIAHLVNGPGDSLTAFKDIRRCLWNVPINDSRLTRGRCELSFGFNCTSSGFISLGLSSIRTIVGRDLSVRSCVHDKSAVVEDSDSGVRYAILIVVSETESAKFFSDKNSFSAAVFTSIVQFHNHNIAHLRVLNAFQSTNFS